MESRSDKIEAACWRGNGFRGGGCGFLKKGHGTLDPIHHAFGQYYQVNWMEIYRFRCLFEHIQFAPNPARRVISFYAGMGQKFLPDFPATKVRFGQNRFGSFFPTFTVLSDRSKLPPTAAPHSNQSKNSLHGAQQPTLEGEKSQGICFCR
jgi:hypothetical protein